MGRWIGPASVCACFALAAGVAPSPAGAQVMEIDAGGQVTTYDGPAVFADGAVRRIETPRAGPPARRRTRQVDRVATYPGAAVTQAAAFAELSPALISAVAWQESRYRPRVLSRAGAIGEMQLMPGTARALGVDPYDSGQNYQGGATYLRALMRRYDGDLIRTLAAYDAGPGTVDRYGGVPPYRETRAYVSAVLDRLSAGVEPAADKGIR